MLIVSCTTLAAVQVSDWPNVRPSLQHDSCIQSGEIPVDCVVLTVTTYATVSAVMVMVMVVTLRALKERGSGVEKGNAKRGQLRATAGNCGSGAAKLESDNRHAPRAKGTSGEWGQR